MKVGDKIRGFKFEIIKGVVSYNKEMDKNIGEIGVVYAIYDETIVVIFNDYIFEYPKKEAEQHLVK